ncbi:hypothetical protein [Pseudopedobacter beijingensis]|uniref:VWA domain-containing protein n=1 Tax=Pseudopedobacter beijingensis TaxID=1207056 RepID=A0ABW4II55_9SPHI
MLGAILFENTSGWWLLLCLATGLFYAYIFYKKQEKGSLKYILFTLRTIVVSVICFLLMAPLLAVDKNVEEKPLLIVAQDNSASIPLAKSPGYDLKSYQKSLDELINKLKAKYKVEVLGFGDRVAKAEIFDYKDQQTDFSTLFNYIDEQYSANNVGGVIIASDGIINRGSSINHQAILNRASVYTIALGDTIPRKDVAIRTVNYNRIAYLDNEYTLEVALQANKSKGESITVNIETSDGQQKRQQLFIENEEWKKNVSFKLDARKVGTHKITINVSRLPEEQSYQNNNRTIYIDVLEGKEKILLVANAPHPDIAALKQSLESNKNYAVDVVKADETPKKLGEYSVIILHNLPSLKFPVKNLLESTREIPIWFIAGTETNMVLLNAAQEPFSLNTAAQFKNHTANLNSQFYGFTLSEATRSFMRNLPPLAGPAGQMVFKGEKQVLMSDQDGQDLWAFSKLRSNRAILLGEGLWRWRIENYKNSDNFVAFDELVSRTVQLLSIKQDKRRFKVYPAKSNFLNNEDALFGAELYNESYQPINDADVAINMSNDAGDKYSFVFNKKDKFYELNAGMLPAGQYNYTASTQLGEKKMETKGYFVIEKVNVEYENLTADHQFLYRLASMSGGEMVSPNQLDKLYELIEENEHITSVVHNDRTFEELINMKWIFAVLLLLLSLEWFLRKRNGLL